MRRTNEETREEVRRTREKLLAEMRRGNAQLPAALNGHTHYRNICAAVLHKLPAIACRRRLESHLFSAPEGIPRPYELRP